MRSPLSQPRPFGIRSILAFALVVAMLVAVPVAVNALTSPRTWVDTPADNSTVTGDLVINGSARHCQGVAIVELVVKNLGDETYWNGNDWQGDFVRFDVPVRQVGAEKTGWTHVLSGEHLVRGDYRVRAFARSVEGNGDAYGGDLHEFRYIPDLDPELYDTEITSPVREATVDGPIRIEGTARSVEGVGKVRVALRHSDTNRYWNAAAGHGPRTSCRTPSPWTPPVLRKLAGR